MPSFAELVKTKREEKGLSLNALAKECGINASYILRLEQGTNKQPSFSNTMRLSRALDIKQSDLVEAFGVQELNRDETKTLKIDENITNKKSKSNINKMMKIIENMDGNSNFAIESITNLLKEVNKFTNKRRKHIFIAISEYLSYIVELEYSDIIISKFLRDNFKELGCREVIYVEGQHIGESKYNLKEMVNLFLEEQFIDESEAHNILKYYEKKVIENEY